MPPGKRRRDYTEGAMDGFVFAAYVELVLAPTPRRGDIILIDNLSAPPLTKNYAGPGFVRRASSITCPLKFSRSAAIGAGAFR